jgi:hypothetical protein
MESDSSNPSIREQLKSTNLVYDRILPDLPKYFVHPAGDDQCARLGIELLGSFKHANSPTRAAEQVCSEQSGSRSSHNSDLMAQIDFSPSKSSCSPVGGVCSPSSMSVGLLAGCHAVLPQNSGKGNLNCRFARTEGQVETVLHVVPEIKIPGFLTPMSMVGL